MNKKITEFSATISEVKPFNTEFSACKVRVLYTGKNRNMSIITKSAVEKALPSLGYVPIVGEFSTEKEDWKGHGGAIDMDTYDFIHTTKAYGVVPVDARYEWEIIGGREYLTIHDCLLWTHRYPEAFTVIEKAKGQSMEIEVTQGEWVEEEEAYRIDGFRFSALCILGDDVTPAFEDASISAYSLGDKKFNREFGEMLTAMEASLNVKEDTTMLKDLLEKYSTTVEILTAKGLVFADISQDELEDKIKEVLGLIEDPSAQVDPEGGNPEGDETPEGGNPEGASAQGDETPEEGNPEGGNPEEGNPEGAGQTEDTTVDVETFEARITELEGQLKAKDAELETLRQFKLTIEAEKLAEAKAEHTAKVQSLFTNFQLTEEDVKDIDIDALTIEEIEDKCYSIIGRKLANKQNFSHKEKEGNLRLPIGDQGNPTDNTLPYGGLVEKYKNKK